MLKTLEQLEKFYYTVHITAVMLLVGFQISLTPAIVPEPPVIEDEYYALDSAE